MNQPIVPITMPRWGIEMLRGTITEWHAAPGQSVKKGAPLLDVETDKIVNSVESPVNGVLREIVTEKGATADAGTLVAVLADPSISDQDVRAFISNFRPADANSAPAPPTPPARSADDAARISPIARRIAERLGIDVSQVTGSGINGRVSKEDVEAYAAANPRQDPGARATAAAMTPATTAATTAGADDAPIREKMTPMRTTIAKRLLESTQSIPHYRLEVDADFSALIEHRASQKTAARPASVNDYVVRAAALALMRHPAINAQLVGDEVLKFSHADISIAVVTDKGLVTPVLRRAETKMPDQIAAESKDLATRARAGTLTREDIAGGSFTISNLGMFAIDRFDAIINAPQVAILAVAAACDRVVARDGKIVVRKMAALTLSVDHRVIDGAEGANFLASLRRLIESPDTLG